MGARASRSAEPVCILLAVSWLRILRPSLRLSGKLAPLNRRLALKTPPLRRTYAILAELKKAKRFRFAEAEREAERRFKITNPWPGVPRPYDPRPRVDIPELPRAGADRHNVMDIIMTGLLRYRNA